MIRDLLLILLLFGCVVWRELPGLIKHKKTKQIILFSCVLALACTIMIAYQIFNVEFDKITKWLISVG